MEGESPEMVACCITRSAKPLRPSDKTYRCGNINLSLPPQSRPPHRRSRASCRVRHLQLRTTPQLPRRQSPWKAP